MVSIPSSRDRTTLHRSVALNWFKSPTPILPIKNTTRWVVFFIVLYVHYRYFLFRKFEK